MPNTQRKLSRDNDKTTFVMSRSRENYVVITRKQDRKIIIMHGRLELPYVIDYNQPKIQTTVTMTIFTQQSILCWPFSYF